MDFWYQMPSSVSFFRSLAKEDIDRQMLTSSEIFFINLII